jgi:hypothetical protein
LCAGNSGHKLATKVWVNLSVETVSISHTCGLKK